MAVLCDGCLLNNLSMYSEIIWVCLKFFHDNLFCTVQLPNNLHLLILFKTKNVSSELIMICYCTSAVFLCRKNSKIWTRPKFFRFSTFETTTQIFSQTGVDFELRCGDIFEHIYMVFILVFMMNLTLFLKNYKCLNYNNQVIFNFFFYILIYKYLINLLTVQIKWIAKDLS